MALAFTENEKIIINDRLKDAAEQSLKTYGVRKTTVEQLGIHTDIHTANHKVDTLPNLQNILDNQKTVADATSTIVAATRTYSQNQQAKADVEKKAKEKVALDELKAKGGADWDA